VLLNISGMEISFLKLNVHIEKLDVSEEAGITKLT